MFGIARYNYPSFTRQRLMKDMAMLKLHRGGPHAGDHAPDFTGRTLAGDPIRLSDFRGDDKDARNVVLTFGSATCPMTAGSIRGMNRLADEYAGDDVMFLFVYVREAHPGERLPAHRDMADKIAAAQVLRDEEDVEMTIVVDDLNGSIHRKYGKLPNSTFVIDTAGRIAFRCLWTQPPVVREALEELIETEAVSDARDPERKRAYPVRGGEDRSFPARYAFVHAHRALERGGRRARREFERAMGLPGRATLLASRVAEPVATNPGKAIAGALIAGGVLTGALFAGFALRRKRLNARLPYNVHERAQRHGDYGEYEAVGI